jgi:hypothetical protein
MLERATRLGTFLSSMLLACLNRQIVSFPDRGSNPLGLYHPIRPDPDHLHHQRLFAPDRHLPVAGVWADRYPRKFLIVFPDLLTANKEQNDEQGILE